VKVPNQCVLAMIRGLGIGLARMTCRFVAATIWRHAGRVGVSDSAGYAEHAVLPRLMDRLRSMTGAGAPTIKPGMCVISAVPACA